MPKISGSQESVRYLYLRPRKADTNVAESQAILFRECARTDPFRSEKNGEKDEIMVLTFMYFPASARILLFDPGSSSCSCLEL